MERSNSLAPEKPRLEPWDELSDKSLKKVNENTTYVDRLRAQSRLTSP